VLLIDATTAEHARGIGVAITGILGALGEAQPDGIIVAHGRGAIPPPGLHSHPLSLVSSRPGRLAYQRLLLPLDVRRLDGPGGRRVDRVLLLDAYAPLIRGSGRVRYGALVHDTLPLSHPEYWPFAKRFVKRTAFSALRRGDTTLFTSTAFNASEIERLLGLKARVARFGCGQLTDAEADAALEAALPARQPYLLYVGAFEPRKGLFVLLDAFERLHESATSELQLLIAGGGDGSYTEALRTRISGSPRADRIRIVTDPDRDTILGLLGEASALVLPTRAEGFGLPLIEAMALGTPAVVSDLPAVRAWAEDAPLYASPTAPEAWAEQILSALTLGDGRRRALQDFARDYRWRLCADELISF